MTHNAAKKMARNGSQSVCNREDALDGNDFQMAEKGWNGYTA
eukprot:CAMPEP_0196652176 /NCGR_PEP_ID=MMETSP1086-20130531/1395_1 /TAXON_ID=77921 /ORGANISM="Cyanoptyche  gloeocystis , Strain SAG4.97" /LENGTH=41 /DNA_ID= /DNA_START= /DNA_END= /DNA_ORIENTATION=